MPTCYNKLMIILFGLAGSGKSTQGQILANKHGLTWLSVGQVLRDTGKFDQILASGELVDDDTTIKLMHEKIQSVRASGQDIILDGFPRDLYQAKWVATHLASDISAAVVLDVPKDELLVRIMTRGREDDTRDAIEKRFQIVERNLSAILRELKKKNIPIKTISGLGSITTVTKRLEKALFYKTKQRTRKFQKSLKQQ